MDKPVWISVDDYLPSSSEVGTWSNSVIAICDKGLLYKLKYFNGKNGGCWQMTGLFYESSSEYVTHWMPFPDIN